MGKIYCMMGKSSSGKDTLYQKVLERLPQIHRVVPYTTRPIRAGEQDGVEYHFVDDKQLAELETDGKVVELRAYNTVHGIWKYFTVDDGQIDLAQGDYLLIGTLETYEKIREYYGAEHLVPIYIEVEDGERLARALERERRQAVPKYKEMCRRFLADEEDFCEENLKRLGIDKRYRNTDMETCLNEITGVMCNGKL
mgnify:CR=1 FL=1